MTIAKIELDFGTEGRFECDFPAAQVIAYHRAPPGVVTVEESIDAALESPLDFPPLRQAIAPGDRVVIALDRNTPVAATLVARIWNILSARGVRPEDVLILQPAAFSRQRLPDPRSGMSEDARERVRWMRHDATDPAQCAYLASTAAGHRIYLAREVVDADLVLTVGPMMYDSVLGYRGTNSVLYPGLSSVDDVRRAHGQGHDELGPDDVRLLRQTIDEVGWLLGVQFTLQVVPAGNDGVAAVLGGGCDAVFARGQELLRQFWRMEVDERPELVVAAIEGDGEGRAWEQIGAALETARQIVAKDGRILLLSGIAEDPSDGFALLRDSRRPRDVLRPLRKSVPPDLLAVTQVARALDWANVYFLSRLDDPMIEELFMIPIGSAQEAARLLDSGDTCAFIASAQLTHASVHAGST